MATKRRKAPSTESIAPGADAPENIAPANPGVHDYTAEPEADPATPVNPAGDELFPETEAVPGTPTTIENMDLTSEQQAAEPARPAKWPSVQERRPVIVKFTTDERAAMANEMGSIISRREDTRAEAKNTAQRYKSQIDDLDEELTGYSDRLREGGREKSLPCTWVFECSGKDEYGELIYHPEMKALFRDDNGDFVSAARISDADRQMDLALIHESAAEPTEETEDGEGEDTGNQESEEEETNDEPTPDPFPEGADADLADMTPEEHACYDTGWSAFDVDAPETDNPYPEGTPAYRAWLKGWSASKEASA